MLASLGLLPLACAGTVEKSGGKPASHQPTCTSPQTDATSGVVSCAEGYSYRPTAGSCTTNRADTAAPAPGPSPDPSTLPRVTDSIECTNDPGVCAAYQYGSCVQSGPLLDGTQDQVRSYCESGCTIDSDCGPNFRCRCGGGQAIGSCVPDVCASDADCEPGYHCASSSAGCGSGAYVCQTSRDKCFGTQDCLASGEGYQVCLVQADGHRECGQGSICGRPFLIEAISRVAPVVSSRAWAKHFNPAPRVDHLTADERLTLAAHWTQMGQMEHASIAAFARFSLQLLSLGAPPELVEACTAALADETAHTKLCFGIASAYAGHAVGPGPLDITGSLAVTSLADIVDLVIAEGCFGETRAALEALEAADSAADPVIAAAYGQIAEDEQRHAELAFRFVRWALERDAQTVLPRITACSTARRSVPAAVRAIAQDCLEALIATQRAA